MDQPQTVLREINELIPYKNNPRNNEKAIDGVAQSIKQFGFNSPIIVDDNDIIIAGHTRLKAAKQLGLTAVPVIKKTDLSNEQVNAYRLADNKVSEASEWDLEQLMEELDGIEDINMDMFGFDDFDEVTNTPFDDVEDDDEEEHYVESNATKYYVGDTLQIGAHTLLCGATTDLKDITMAIYNKQVELIPKE